tara:strand:- start:247 stop:408 length:162 start_codon:yes stop_codon:yes gene_type:complete
MLLGCQAPSALSGFCVKSKVLTKLDFEISLLLAAYSMDENLIALRSLASLYSS